jgi:hypothetical protein
VIAERPSVARPAPPTLPPAATPASVPNVVRTASKPASVPSAGPVILLAVCAIGVLAFGLLMGGLAVYFLVVKERGTPIAAVMPTGRTDKGQEPVDDPGAAPAQPAALKPAPLQNEKETRPLPSAVASVAVGGGGRYLILHLPRERKLAVFDAGEAKVVKYLPVAEDTVNFTAGLDKLFLFLPTANVLQRWSLTSLEREVTVPAPVAVKSIAIGSAAREPLVIATGEQRFDGKALVFLDPQTFKDAGYQTRSSGFIGFPDERSPLRVGADGSLVTVGQQVWVRQGKDFVGHQNEAGGMPGPDGQTLFAPGRLYSAEGKPLGDQVGGHDHRVWYVPALHGRFYLSLNEIRERNVRQSSLSLGVQMLGDRRPLVTLRDVDGLDGLVDWQRGQPRPFDQHVFLIPDAQLLVVLAASGDKLHLQRFDLDAALDKSGIDYLYVASRPPSQVKPGDALSYRIEVKSKRGGVKYRLESGPEGMKLSSNGLLTWQVPARPETQSAVLVTISDASGQEIFHSFSLTAVGVVEKPPVVPEPKPLPPEPKINEPPVKPVEPPVKPVEPPVKPVAPEPPPKPVEPAEPGKSLVAPPAVQVSITPAPLKEDVTTLALPSAVSDIAVGGGGRYLFLHLPKERQLAVFDASAARVIRYLPLAEDNVKFAAGMDKLFILLTDKSILQRWNLVTMEREVTAPLPVTGTVKTMLMGSASGGPLFLGGVGGIGERGVTFLDPLTMKPLKPQGNADVGIGFDHYPPTVRVSADGRVYGLWQQGLSPSGLRTMVIDGMTLKNHYEHTSVGHILPGPDGQTLFTGAGLYTAQTKKIGEKTGFTLPALHGSYYLALDNPFNVHPNQAKERLPVAVHMLGDARPLITLPSLEGLDRPDIFNRNASLPLDKRLFLVPDARLLVTIPLTADKLYLHRFDLDQALEKAGIDYLFVTSRPLTTAVKGARYEYAPTVKSKKGGVKLKLESGPPGMKLENGRLTWSVPADFAESPVNVIVTVSDATGQEIFHTFAIAVVAKAANAPAPPKVEPMPKVEPKVEPKEEPKVEPKPEPKEEPKQPAEGDAAAPMIHAAPLKGDAVTLNLPASVEATAVGGGGRFLILHLPKNRQLAIFDVNEAKIVKHLAVAEDSIKFAAGLNKLFVFLPTAHVLQRYSLKTFEREVTMEAPIKGSVTHMLMGFASQGPLVLGAGVDWGRGGRDSLVLDPRTLKPQLLSIKGSGAFDLRSSWRVSGDGQVFTSREPFSQPQHQAVYLLKGTELQEARREINAWGHLLPGRDGRHLFTGSGVFTLQGSPAGKVDNSGMAYALPAVEGGSFYLNLEVSRQPAILSQRENKPAKLSLHVVGDTRPLAVLDQVDVPRGLSVYDQEKLGADQRLFLVPSAKLLVVLPTSNEQLLLYRVDTDDLLSKSDRDYLFVTSQPPAQVVKGATLRYDLTVKSKKGGVKYKLDAGPEGMKVSADGRLTWAVPAAFADSEVNVILSITDASGQEVFHSFKVAVTAR